MWAEKKRLLKDKGRVKYSLQAKTSEPSSLLPADLLQILLLNIFYSVESSKGNPGRKKRMNNVLLFSRCQFLSWRCQMEEFLWTSWCVSVFQVLSICPKDMRADICVHLNRKVCVCGSAFKRWDSVSFVPGSSKFDSFKASFWRCFSDYGFFWSFWDMKTWEKEKEKVHKLLLLVSTLKTFMRHDICEFPNNFCFLTF